MPNVLDWTPVSLVRLLSNKYPHEKFEPPSTPSAGLIVPLLSFYKYVVGIK